VRFGSRGDALRKGICVEVASGTVLSTQPMLLQPPLETSSNLNGAVPNFGVSYDLGLTNKIMVTHRII
jgi:hypothetical protein